MAGKGNSEKIKSSTEQDKIRRTVKQSRTPRKRHNQQSQTTTEFNAFTEGRELQVAAMRAELAKLTVNERRRSFLDAMLSVYAELRKSDLMVGGKRITSVAATFDKIRRTIGEETLTKFKKDWSSAKDMFFRVEKTHPLSKYCAQAQNTYDALTRVSEEHLTQTLGSPINKELVSA